MEELMEWTICGRAIGKASGWDLADAFIMNVYDLKGASGYKGLVGECVTFDFEKGLIRTIDEAGNLTASVDLIDAIIACPVDRIE